MLAYFIAALSPNMDVANAALPAYVVTLLFFAGFLLRWGDIPKYWQWYGYIDFLHYAWGALMANQFAGDRNVVVRQQCGRGSACTLLWTGPARRANRCCGGDPPWPRAMPSLTGCPLPLLLRLPVHRRNRIVPGHHHPRLLLPRWHLHVWLVWHRGLLLRGLLQPRVCSAEVRRRVG